MTKDYVKIYEAIDNQERKVEKEKIQTLQKAGIYPMSFDFPLTLQFEMTSHCNVFCKHCYNNSGTANSIEDLMTPEKWITFAKYLVSKGGIFECILSGGEPLLMGDSLFEIMDILHEDGTCFLLITNGYLLTQEKVKKLSKYRYHWIQVSIDGVTAKYHDTFRRREGCWERAVNGAYMISAAGIPLTIAHCVTPENLDQVDEMCDLAYSLGASSIILGEINLSGRVAENRELLLSREQKSLLLEKYEINLSKYQGKMLVQRSATAKNSVMRYIGMPNSGMIIRPNGDIRLDCMTPFVIGNILKDDFSKIWNEKHDTCWNHPKVVEYISQFNEEDTNNLMTNYVDNDIYI